MEPTTVVAIVAGVLMVAGFLQLFLRWEEHRFPELREVLVRMYAYVQDQKPAMADDGKQIERDLQDVIDQLRHKKVKALAETVMKRWKETFASEPGPWVLTLNDLDSEANQQYFRRVELHKEKSDECLAAIQMTKTAMTHADRFTYPTLR